MKYAIIAAGEGARLAAEGIAVPKPLVKVGGERLVDRLLRIFKDNGATEIDVICNDLTPLVSRHLEQLEQQLTEGEPLLRHMVRTTPGSMHSFFALTELIGESSFVLTTVDTLFREAEFGRYVSAFREALAAGYDGVMGVTSFVDDEKPLYVAVDAESNITGYYDAPCAEARYVSAGIYGLTPRALPVLRRCMENGRLRMRQFQRALVEDGCRLRAFEFGTVFDVDHAGDIAKAERFLAAQ